MWLPQYYSLVNPLVVFNHTYIYFRTVKLWDRVYCWFVMAVGKNLIVGKENTTNFENTTNSTGVVKALSNC
jgi:hypothetical protein